MQLIQLHKFYLAIPYKSTNFVVLATLEISTRIFFVANIAVLARVFDTADAINIDRKFVQFIQFVQSEHSCTSYG